MNTWKFLVAVAIVFSTTGGLALADGKQEGHHATTSQESRHPAQYHATASWNVAHFTLASLYPYDGQAAPQD